MTARAAMEVLAREAACHEGAVPSTLPGALKEAPAYAITRNAFLLKLPSGLSFHYQQGQGVTVSRPDSVPESEVALFLNGSVYGAIAWINGYVPLHASGVVHQGQVHAFTGASGAGKSTLVAALGGRGLPLFADDVLVLDLSNPAAIMCLPGHKQIKLWGDALALTGLDAGAAVRPELDKFYVVPKGGMHFDPLPLAQLNFLDSSPKDGPHMAPISGADRFSYARAAFYRPFFCAAIADNQTLFATIARLARAVPMARFRRSLRRADFAASTDFMAAAIRGEDG
jgi:hypothetical protein